MAKQLEKLLCRTLFLSFRYQNCIILPQFGQGKKYCFSICYKPGKEILAYHWLPVLQQQIAQRQNQRGIGLTVNQDQNQPQDQHPIVIQPYGSQNIL